MRTRQPADKNYAYEYGDYDEAYEQYGDEFEHAENCDWIYDNCTCEQSEPESAENMRLKKLLEQY